MPHVTMEGPFEMKDMDHAAGRIVLLAVNDFLSKLTPCRPFFDDGAVREVPIGGLPRLARAVKEERRRNPGQVLAAVMGIDPTGPWFDRFHGRAEFEGLARAGFDLGVPGFHEFDYGPEIAGRTLDFAGFPLLCANLKALHPALAERFEPCAVLDRGGLKVGLFGLAAISPIHLFQDGPCLAEIGPVTEVAARMVERLRARGCRVIVALTHIGLEADTKVAEAVPGIHAILGAHSHTVTDRPLMVVGPQGWRTAVVQAGTGGASMGRLELVVANGRLDEAGTDWRLLIMDNESGEDEEVTRFVGDLERELAAHQGRDVARLKGDWDARLVTIGSGESALANFMADAFRWRLGADLGVVEARSFRCDRVFPAGPLTFCDLQAILPFGEPLLLFQLRGRDLLRLLELSAAALGPADGAGAPVRGQAGSLLHFSGLRVAYDLSRRPTRMTADGVDWGRRVVDANLQTRSGSVRVQEEGKYTMAASAFLILQGEYRPALPGMTWYNTGHPDRRAFADYVHSLGGSIDPCLEGRIIVTGQPKECPGAPARDRSSPE